MKKGKERESDFYNGLYTHRKYKQRNRAIWRIILEEFIHEPTRILDLGCGDGMFGMFCLQHGHTYTGVDYSPVAINNAKLKTPRAKYYIVDLREDRRIIEQGDYDTITAIEFFEHIHQDLKVIETIPSGKRVLFSVPTFWSKDHVRIYETEQVITDRYQDLLEIQHIEASHKRGKIRKYAVKATRK